MIIRRLLIAFLVSAGLFTCATAREARVTVLATGGLEGRILSPVQGGYPGGLAAVLELIGRENAASAIWVDCGNAFGLSYESRDFPISDYLAWMREAGCAGWVPGHLDWERVLPLLSQNPADPPALAVNVAASSGLQVQPWRMVQVDGIRVALIGLAFEEPFLNYLPDEVENLSLEESVEALGRIMPAVREANPEICLLILDHGEREKQFQLGFVTKIARKFPEIDAVIASAPMRARYVGSLYYACAPLNASRVLRLDIRYNTVEQGISHMETRLLFSPKNGPSGCPSLMNSEAYSKWLAEKERAVAMQAPPENATSDGLDSSALAGRALCRALSADAAVFDPPAEASLPQGAVTVADVLRIYPQNWIPATLLLTPEEIESALAELWSRQNELRLHGLQAKWDAEAGILAAPLRLADGSPAHPRKRYRIVFPLHLLTSQGGRFPRLRALATAPVTRLEISPEDFCHILIQELDGSTGGEADNKQVFQ